jgi:hypothetical protein
MSSYQIAFFANRAESHAETLRNTIRRNFKEIGIPLDLLALLDDKTVAARDRKAPIVGVYFGLTRDPGPASPGLSDLLKEATLVVPVVPQLAEFSQFVPDDLRVLNGMELRPEDHDLNCVASVLLEGLSLLRKSRRLFISYRRIETQGIAIQLYELLDAHGFDVFLDSHSIRPGEPFQEVLWHRLADTDVIVLLDSPGFLANRWTEAELAQANSTNIQILQLIWPRSTLQAAAAFSRPFLLVETDFFDSKDMLGASARLHDACLNRVAVEVESLRARALAARYAYLVQEFCAEAEAVGFAPRVQPERFILLKTKSSNYVIVVPTVGVPDAVRYQEIEDEISRHPKRHDDIILLYDERGIREKWAKHITWLDHHRLQVKSLQVAQAQSWLGGLR